MTRSALPLVLLAAVLVPGPAAAVEQPYAYHGDKAYTNDFPAAVTVDATLVPNSVQGGYEFTLTCTGTQPDVPTRIECWFDTPDFTVIWEGSGPGTAVVHRRGWTTFEPEDLRFCVLLLGTPFPPECAELVR